MTEVARKNIKRKSCNYIDVYGTKFSISAAKDNNVRFTLHHEQVLEGLERKEFEYMSVIIEPSNPIFFQIGELYSRIGNALSWSRDPIRDGRNCLVLEKDQEHGHYFLTFCRDLSNELNLPLETNVVLNEQPFVEFYDEISTLQEEKGKQYQIKLTH